MVAVTGRVEKRSAAVNENLKTGDIEIIASDIRILSEAETPPFPVEENSQTKEDMRLRYRYLDLRRPDIQRNLMMKSKVAMLLRNFMAKEGFLEIETPILTKSTPGQEIIWCQAVCIQAVFMHCLSLPNCLNSF